MGVKNSKQLNDVWRTEGVDFKEVTQTLGIDWGTESDTFSIYPLNVTGEHVEGPATKMQFLQATARFFNPWTCYPLHRSLGNYYFVTRGAED